MADDEEKYAQRKAPQKPSAAKRPHKPRPVAVVLCNGNCELHGCEQGCVGCQACVNAGLFAMFFFGAFYYDVYFRFFGRKARRQ